MGSSSIHPSRESDRQPLLVMPDLWTTPQGHLHRDRLLREGADQACRHSPPLSRAEWPETANHIRKTLWDRLHLHTHAHPLDIEFHGDISLEGYRIRKISYASTPEIRVTGNLFIPDGPGPFPAVLNCHGHWMQGKISKRVQDRGHVLALNGIVTLSVDAAGAGERCESEQGWEYHGAQSATDLFLHGDSLLAWQVRDNRRALDVLESFSFVDPERLGATGASGGGNQVAWLSALDERVKVTVPVVSVGSFQAYITRCNCICETLPGGLTITEQWGLLSLIAPRPLLVLTALHDKPAFHYTAMTPTCQQVQEIYASYDARQNFDARILDMSHGYFPPALEGMLGWMRHWLQNEPRATPVSLPEWSSLPEELLLCYPSGQRPPSCSYAENRKSISQACQKESVQTKSLDQLAAITGWHEPHRQPAWIPNRTSPHGMEIAAIMSQRSIPIPVIASQRVDESCQEIHLILSPDGKKSSFVSTRWAEAAAANALAVTTDLPAIGELSWDENSVPDCRFHDSTRACLWLGYTLIGEWAEAISTLCQALQAKAPLATITIMAHQEMAFATLIAQALHPLKNIQIQEFDCPKSIRDEKSHSLAWVVPDFLLWGDLDDLRAISRHAPQVQH